MHSRRRQLRRSGSTPGGSPGTATLDSSTYVAGHGYVDCVHPVCRSVFSTGLGPSTLDIVNALRFCGHCKGTFIFISMADGVKSNFPRLQNYCSHRQYLQMSSAHHSHSIHVANCVACGAWLQVCIDTNQEKENLSVGKPVRF